MSASPDGDRVYARPADFCRALLAAADASEGRRRRRKRDTTPDALGLGVKRAMLERLVAEDPDPDDLDAWLLAQCLAPSGPHGAGAVRAMALEILDEWRLCRTSADSATGSCAARPPTIESPSEHDAADRVSRRRRPRVGLRPDRLLRADWSE